MTKTSIRQLSIEEAAPTFSWLTSYCFHNSPPPVTPESFLERFKFNEATTRYMAAYDGDTAVASAAAGQFTQNLRGALMPMSGIFMVATHPAARRKHFSASLLAALLKAERENGQPLSCLYPFRESFYERLGYANLPINIQARINIRSLLPLQKQGYGDQLEFCEFVNDPEPYRGFLREYRQHTHGMAMFNSIRPPDPNSNNAWIAISRTNGKADGCLVYRMQGEKPTQFKMDVIRFYYLNPAARYHFLGWISRHIDQTSEVLITLPAFEQPNTWYNDLEVSLSHNFFAPMCRVLDVAGLAGIPVGSGGFSARVSDPICPWNEGVWQFESQDGKLAINPAKAADCSLSIQGLSSLVYGVEQPASYAHRGWGDPSPEVAGRMLDLFPPKTPHLHEFF